MAAQAIAISVPARPYHQLAPPSFSLKALNFALTAIAVIGLPFFASRARELGLSGPTDNVLLNIRYAINVEGERFGVLAYLFPVAMISVGIHVLFADSYSKTRSATVLGLALAYAVLFTGRTFFFLILVYTVGILLITRRISVGKASATFASLALVAFVLLGIALQKGVNPDASLLENMLGLAQSFQAYLLGPIAALDWLLRQDLPLAWGDNALRSAYVLYSVADNEQTRVVPLVRDFVAVGVETNVYTVYDPYLRDFGLFGALGFVGLIGLACGWLYRMTYTSSNPAWILAYALSLYPLLMQFFQDQYVSLLSTWVQYGVLLLVFGVLSKPSTTAPCAR